jgi:hypothetical protein
MRHKLWWFATKICQWKPHGVRQRQTKLRPYLQGTLAAQVRHGAQGVVEAVRKISRANNQRELDDLSLVEQSPQVCKGTVTDRSGTSRDAFSMQNYCLLFLIEQRAALVE